MNIPLKRLRGRFIVHFQNYENTRNSLCFGKTIATGSDYFPEAAYLSLDAGALCCNASESSGSRIERSGCRREGV